jgi:peroxiredoxin
MALWKHRKLLATGARAPEFRLPRLDGGETQLAEIVANGPALLAFFKTSCPVCQFTLPFLARLDSSQALPVYGISQNNEEETREFVREFGVTFPVLLDTEDSGFAASNAFGISTVPTLFLVQRDGTLARVVEGWSRRDIDWLGLQAGTSVFRQDEHVPEWKAG